jgi:hypothetical protein
MKLNQVPYETRVQMVYDWLKSLIVYEQFPDAIKIQLVDVDQIAVVEDQLKSRELIDFSNEKSVELTEVFGQIGMTIEKVLFDSKGYHSEFIDNLLIGTHSIFSFNLLRKQFKDIFIYEKSDALESVNFEYNIVINDLESEAPVLISIPKQSKPVIEEAIVPETVEALELDEDPVAPMETLPDMEIVADEPELQIDEEEQIVLDSPPDSDVHDEDIPDILPSASSSRKPRAVDDEDELDFEMDTLFTGAIHDHDVDLEAKKKSPIVPILIGITLVILLFISGKVIFGSEPVEAQFSIEPLMESRVAFMNESTGKKNIDEYLWEIYFEEEFVQSFNDENLFPIFETEGKYTITLKVKDKDGEWSEPYSLEYNFQN